MASVRKPSNLRREKSGLGDFEDLAELLDVLLRRLGLSVEDGCYGNLFATELFGNGLEAEVLLFLLGEEHGRMGRETGNDLLLEDCQLRYIQIWLEDLRSRQQWADRSKYLVVGPSCLRC